MTQKLIGTWTKKAGSVGEFTTEYREDGSFATKVLMHKDPVVENTLEGKWKIEGSKYWFKIEQSTMWIKNGKSEPFTKQEDNDWNFRTIISITETEFKSQLEGQNPNIEFKEN